MIDYPYGSLDVFPVGVNPPRPKKDIVRVSGGETIILKDYIVDVDEKPVTPEKDVLFFCLRAQKFADTPIWVGGWNSGITLNNDIPGHVMVKIPDRVSISLRRGSYVYSLLVMDKLLNNRRICMKGSLLVEYESMSPHLSIPYKDKPDTSSDSSSSGATDSKYVTGVNFDAITYFPDNAGIVHLPKDEEATSLILPFEGHNYALRLTNVDGVISSYWDIVG